MSALAVDPHALTLAQELVERMLAPTLLDRSYELTRSGSDVSDYLSFKRNEQSREPSTLDQYERDLARLCTTYATRAPHEITTDDIRAVRDTYPEGSRHRVTAVYRDFFRWLYEEGRTEQNPAARIRYPKRKPAPLTDLFTDEEKAAIVAAQETIRDRACVLLLLRAGLRKGELRQLRVRDIDLADRLILVRRGKGSILWMWSTRRIFREGEAARVARAWGFEPCGEVLWGLRNPGLGGAHGNDHEPVLIARRGTARVGTTLPLGVTFWRQPYAHGKIHSAKPDGFLDLVESVSPGPYLEMFARRQRLGWDTWGNEALEHVEIAS